MNWLKNGNQGHEFIVRSLTSKHFQNITKHMNCKVIFLIPENKSLFNKNRKCNTLMVLPSEQATIQ